MKRLFSLMVFGLVVIIGGFYNNQAQDYYSRDVPTGEIEGRVLNAQGQPVSGATVYALENRFLRGGIPSEETDTNGFFNLIVPPGTYRVYAGKESDGYPETLDPFYQGAVSYVEVQVNEDQITSSVILRLGSQLGRLSGRIIDASTNSPLTDVYITLRLADNPSHSIVTNVINDDGRFEVIVPPAQFTIEVSAPGYQNWHYRADNPGSETNALQLRPGDVRELVVPLRAINNQN